MPLLRHLRLISMHPFPLALALERHYLPLPRFLPRGAALLAKSFAVGVEYPLRFTFPEPSLFSFFLLMFYVEHCVTQCYLSALPLNSLGLGCLIPIDLPVVTRKQSAVNASCMQDLHIFHPVALSLATAKAILPHIPHLDIGGSPLSETIDGLISSLKNILHLFLVF